MAHELNNPLGIVLQSLENLERRFSAELPANQPAAREAGLDLRVVGRYLSGIVETALELAAKDNDLRRKFDFRAVSIVRELDVRTPLVACTAGEMVQVVLNIVKNAAEALADGGSRDGEPTIRVSTRPDGSFARLEIRDNGPRMDEATRRRVFEPYFSTKGPGGGTGLGLSVAYFIVTQRNAGTIAVESSPGQGTEFVIRLPVAAASGPTSA